MSRKLIVTDGRRQRELLLVTRIVVGRDPTCDLSEADPLLSRRHAEFSIAGNDIVVRDLGSRNGIYVNGSRIAEGTLQSGDVVRIGRLQLRYLEDSAPLVAVPELDDDATGIVFPGPRGPASSPAAPAARPPMLKPQAPAPALAPAGEPDADATSYVSGVRRPPAQTGRSASQGAPTGDAAEQTRVVPPPTRPGSPAAAAPIRPAVPPPPAASDREDEPTKFTPRPRTSVQPLPSAAAIQTAVQPPPSPPKEDRDEPTSIVTSRPRTVVQPKAADASGDTARQARALATTIDAIATFLGSAAIGQDAAEAVKILQRDLTNGAAPADLVNALKSLAARVSAAASELS